MRRAHTRAGMGLGPAIPAREITPEQVYGRRRDFLRGGAAAALGAGTIFSATRPALALSENDLKALPGVKPSGYKVDEAKTPFADVSSYNNFYEFGTGKGDPAENAHTLKTSPWSVQVSGAAGKTGTFTLEDILQPHALEERIYRLRCVEAWSMVIPWVGFPLADLLKRFEPTSQAKYVQFLTLNDRTQMPGVRSSVLEWPYREGLTIAEAMHPLAFVAVGLYGKVIPNQNGAPLRTVVPWKYGFKSCKSIVRIHFTDRQPQTSWNMSAPQEYGFYSNVNPQVDHPRWSQASERRLGGLISPRIPTQMFNGYAEQVASLYTGLDLVKNY